MKPEKIKATRIYSADDGLSYFEDVLIPALYPVAKKQKISKALGQGRLFEFDADFECDWHISAKKSYYIYIQGRQAVEVSGGEKREFAAGDILLAEDTTGKGHKSWSIADMPGRAIIIEM